VLACGGFYLLVEAVKITLWIGSRDVELHFVVVDKRTGKPIEGRRSPCSTGTRRTPPSRCTPARTGRQRGS
jgi:hypothetical protein